MTTNDAPFVWTDLDFTYKDNSKNTDKTVDRTYEEIDLLSRQIINIQNKINQLNQTKENICKIHNLPLCVVPMKMTEETCKFIRFQQNSGICSLKTGLDVGHVINSLINNGSNLIIVANDEVILDDRKPDNLTIKEEIEKWKNHKIIDIYYNVVWSKFSLNKINKLDLYVKNNISADNTLTICITFINNSDQDMDDVSMYMHITEENAQKNKDLVTTSGHCRKFIKRLLV